ncbi:MAG TPA: acetate--CoA ligase family protein [Bordetella sp.]
MSDNHASASSRPLAHLLQPSSIAVIGASEDQTKFGGRLLRMLLRHRFAGQIYPVNPGRKQLFGLQTWSNLGDLPQAPDMAVLTIPQPAIKAQIETAARMGVRCCVIITSGFSDASAAGAQAEAEIVEIARTHGMRLIGPNCLGIISAVNRLALCSSPVLEIAALPQQPIGFVSQSGALMTTFFDRAWSQGIGFSHGVSVGNQADLELCDFVEFLADDPDTRVICTYIEGVKDAARFVQAARRVKASGKPWLAVKAGRTEAGSRAAFSHTASIAGDYAVFAAVCREEGVTLMSDVGAMVTLAAMLARYGERRVDRLAILTPSGGGGALASDALSERGVKLAEFSEQTRALLAQHYPEGQANNPVDFGSRKTVDPVCAANATLQALETDARTDGVMIPVTMAPPAWLQAFARAQPEAGAAQGKPVLFTLEAGHASDELRELLSERKLPYTNHIGEAAHVWETWRDLSTRPGVQEQPANRPKGAGPERSLSPGDYGEDDSKACFARYGIPVNQGEIAASADQAVEIAERMGYPVVMKVVSPDIVHKTEAGAVAVGVADTSSVRERYDGLIGNAARAVPSARLLGVSVQTMVRGELELIVGARRDPQFGPIVVFGAGGILVELLRSMAVARAPTHPDHVLALLRTLPIWPVLQGYRGSPLAIDAAVDAIVRVSWLAHDLAGSEFECDINPLIVGRRECWAVDARLRIAQQCRPRDRT